MSSDYLLIFTRCYNKIVKFCRILFVIGLCVNYVGCGGEGRIQKTSQRIEGSQDPKKAFEYGEKWYERRDFARAISKFTDAISADPNYVEAYIGRANAEREIGNSLLIREDKVGGNAYHTSALVDFTKALQLAPNNAEIYYCVGLLYFERVHNIAKVFTIEEREGDRKNAITYFRKYFEIANSIDCRANYYLGLLLAEENDIASRKEAAKYIKSYMEFREIDLVNLKKVVPKDNLEQIQKQRIIQDIETELSEFKNILKDIEQK